MPCLFGDSVGAVRFSRLNSLRLSFPLPSVPSHPVDSSNYTTVTGLRAGKVFLNHDWTVVVPCYSKSAAEWPDGVDMHISVRETRINPGLGVVAVARAYMSPFSASWTTLGWSSKAFGQ